MKKIRIRGGKPLMGEIKISGAKNAVLPVISAAMLTNKRVILENVPHITDVYNSCEIVKCLGGSADLKNNILVLDNENASGWEIPCEQALKMRSSVLFAGALLARHKRVFLPETGGCKLGKRPVDMHILAFEKMGAKVTKQHKGYFIEAEKLIGTVIEFKKKSVGATENIILAAVTAEGTTVIKNAAVEPEITELAYFLNLMGADIKGAGSNIIVINGVKELNGTVYRIMPDRIEAGTYLCAAAAAGGQLVLRNVQPEHLKSLTDVLLQCGCIINYRGDSIAICSKERLLGGIKIKTAPFPDFPTDLQAQIMAVLATADGISTVEEGIFSSRKGHIGELNKMGADIKVITNRKFFIKGDAVFKGAKVKASDLRAGAALIIAALCAEGETVIDNAEYIFRGYENIAEKLKGVGADIEYI